mgnify:CR=1 FL=1
MPFIPTIQTGLFPSQHRLGNYSLPIYDLKISENYDSHVALKAPAHITLQKPFFRMKSQEPDLILKLNNFSTGHSGFEISLNGYGSFPPRTIYIRPEMTDDLKILYKIFREYFHKTCKTQKFYFFSFQFK